MGFRCGQQSSQPATTASGFDRKATRNPQLHIVPSVIGYCKGCANKLLRQDFWTLQRTFFISGGDFYAEDSSSFDNLCLREKSKTLGRQFFGVRQRVFHFDRDFYKKMLGRLCNLTVHRCSTVLFFISTV